MFKWLCFSIILTTGCIESPQTTPPEPREECENACTLGETKCENADDVSAYSECTTERDGNCPQWEFVESCGTGQTCTTAVGCECVDECEVGTMDCSEADGPTRCVQTDSCAMFVSDCVEAAECEASGREAEIACEDPSCQICVGFTR